MGVSGPSAETSGQLTSVSACRVAIKRRMRPSFGFAFCLAKGRVASSLSLKLLESSFLPEFGRFLWGSKRSLARSGFLM